MLFFPQLISFLSLSLSLCFLLSLEGLSHNLPFSLIVFEILSDPGEIRLSKKKLNSNFVLSR